MEKETKLDLSMKLYSLKDEISTLYFKALCYGFIGEIKKEDQEKVREQHDLVQKLVNEILEDLKEC